MTNQGSKQFPKTGTGFFYGYWIVTATFFTMLVLWGVHYSFGIFFTPLLQEFGWSRATASGAFALSSIIYGILAAAMGGLTDRFGPRIVMTSCGLLLGLGYSLMSQISALWQFYLLYGIVIAVGMSCSYVPLLSTVARWFIARRSMMTGISTAGIGIGSLIVPPVASRLISTYGWRTSYMILGAMALAVLALFAQVIKRDPTEMGQAAFGMREDQAGRSKLRAEGLSLRDAATTIQFWVVFAMNFSFGFCLFTVLVHIAPHATDLKISATGAANTLATVGGVSIIGRIVLGRVGDSMGSARTYVLSLILMSAALFLLVAGKMPWMLYFFAAVFGFAYGGCVISLSPLVAVLFGLSSHGLNFGVVNMGFTIGGAVGPVLNGHLFDVTGSYHLAFLACAAVSLAGGILGTLLKERRVEV